MFAYSETNGTVTESTPEANKGFYRVDNKLYQGLEAAEAELIFSGTDDTGTNPLAWLRKNFTKDTWNLGTIDFGNFKSAVGAAVNSKDLGYLAFLYEKIKDATTLPLRV